MQKYMQIVCVAVAFTGSLLLQEVHAQRPFYAGSSQYKNNFYNKRKAASSSSAPIKSLAYGEPQRPPVGSYVTPEPTYTALPQRVPAPRPSADLPMPMEAGGDRDLVERLSRLPENQRPFWLLNHKAIEAQRNGMSSGYRGPTSSSSSFFG